MAWNPLLCDRLTRPEAQNAAIFGMKAKARGGPRTLMAAQGRPDSSSERRRKAAFPRGAGRVQKVRIAPRGAERKKDDSGAKTPRQLRGWNAPLAVTGKRNFRGGAYISSSFLSTALGPR